MNVAKELNADHLEVLDYLKLRKQRADEANDAKLVNRGATSTYIGKVLRISRGQADYRLRVLWEKGLVYQEEHPGSKNGILWLACDEEVSVEEPADVLTEPIALRKKTIWVTPDGSHFADSEEAAEYAKRCDKLWLLYSRLSEWFEDPKAKHILFSAITLSSDYIKRVFERDES
jgi:hypothetical protein